MRSTAAAESGARPRLVWITTPLALMTGWSDGLNCSCRRVRATCSRRSTTVPAVDRAASPRAIESRTAAAAARRAPTVASAPKRASSARIVARWRSSSIDGINLKSGIAEMRGLQKCRITRVERSLHPGILQSRNPAILCYQPLDQLKTRPLERFWPYAELPEQPTEEQLAVLDPDLQEALFGAQARPFSITIVFPPLDSPEFPRALELARASAEYRETGRGAALRHRARFR